MAGEKTEAPTGKRRGAARQRGQVARSVELNSAALLLAAYMALLAYGASIYQQLRMLMETVFRNLAVRDVTPDQAHTYLVALALWTGQLLAPFILVLMAAGITVNVAQTGFLFTLQPLQPNLSRLNVFGGFARIFARRTAALDLAKSMAKIALIGVIVWKTVEGRLPLLVSLARIQIEAGLAQIVAIALEIFVKVALAVLVLGVIDYYFQRKEVERALRMTKQEVKEELKQSEGDPAIKARLRRQMRTIAQRRMMQRVPRADVVITNPTHLAVALEYDPAKMLAPVVVAKGADVVAERIKEIAREHSVPVVENKPLAQALYRSVELDQQIPASLYHAVAELLAFVYGLRHSNSAPSRPAAAPVGGALGAH